MDPYRSAPQVDQAEAPRDAGIVGDVIAQFADPYAFFRELVQNAIDAGTPSVEIRIRYDEADPVMHVAVRDRGEGMTRDIVENQLLVLFRSTKERDPTKIGKFGIGFASVLAPNPDVVAVHTVRDGKKLVMHLRRDLGYELFDGGRATHSGTTVELDIPLAPELVAAFLAASRRALLQWCRHASVPIELTVSVPGRAPETERIDRPFALDGALVEVRREDGPLVALVGLADVPYTGFFNHGLMLHESPRPLIGKLAIKIQDSRLGHTLSRDNVRQDEAYDRALGVASELATQELPRAVSVAIAAAADARDLPRHAHLLRAAVAAGLELPEWTLPLVEPWAERSAITAGALPAVAWTATAASPLTHAIPAPVVLAHWDDGLAPALARAIDRELVPVETALTCITPIATSDGDVALVALLAEMFGAAGRTPGAIVLAELHGALAEVFALAGPETAAVAPCVIDRDRAALSPFGRLRRMPLVLSIAHPAVQAARTHDDPVLAAAHLARAVLLMYRLLDVERSTALLDHALHRLGGA